MPAQQECSTLLWYVSQRLKCYCQLSTTGSPTIVCVHLLGFPVVEHAQCIIFWAPCVHPARSLIKMQYCEGSLVGCAQGAQQKKIILVVSDEMVGLPVVQWVDY